MQIDTEGAEDGNAVGQGQDEALRPYDQGALGGQPNSARLTAAEPHLAGLCIRLQRVWQTGHQSPFARVM